MILHCEDQLVLDVPFQLQVDVLYTLAARGCHLMSCQDANFTRRGAVKLLERPNFSNSQGSKEVRTEDLKRIEIATRKISDL